MSYKLFNQTTNPIGLNLLDGNAIHLYPVGSVDGFGTRIDCDVVLDDEMSCPDVQNHVRTRAIVAEKIATQVMPKESVVQREPPPSRPAPPPTAVVVVGNPNESK